MPKIDITIARLQQYARQLEHSKQKTGFANACRRAAKMLATKGEVDDLGWATDAQRALIDSFLSGQSPGDGDADLNWIDAIPGIGPTLSKNLHAHGIRSDLDAFNYLLRDEAPKIKGLGAAKKKLLISALLEDGLARDESILSGKKVAKRQLAFLSTITALSETQQRRLVALGMTTAEACAERLDDGGVIESGFLDEETARLLQNTQIESEDAIKEEMPPERAEEAMPPERAEEAMPPDAGEGEENSDFSWEEELSEFDILSEVSSGLTEQIDRLEEIVRLATVEPDEKKIAEVREENVVVTVDVPIKPLTLHEDIVASKAQPTVDSDGKLFPLLNCPNCFGNELERHSDRVECRRCGVEIMVNHGVILMQSIAPKLEPFNREWLETILQPWLHRTYLFFENRTLLSRVISSLNLDDLGDGHFLSIGTRYEILPFLTKLAEPYFSCVSAQLCRNEFLMVAEQCQQTHCHGRMVACSAHFSYLSTLAKEARARKLPNIDAVYSTASTLPFPDASFSRILLDGLSLEAKKISFTEFIRVLKPGERLVLTLPRLPQASIPVAASVWAPLIQFLSPKPPKEFSQLVSQLKIISRQESGINTIITFQRREKS